ncbi:hypothetical protein LCGC14_2058520, partial [marine sediment metagenome]
RYNVAIEDGDLKVYDMEGVEKSVDFPNGKAYLNYSNPKDIFSCVTVADYTFVLNKEIKTAKSEAIKAARPFEALIWVRQGAYGSNYAISVDDVQVASYTVPDGGTASHSTSVTTTNIAAQLQAGLTSNLPAGITSTRYGSTIHISSASTDFTIKGSSPNGGTFMRVVKESVQSFSDLPSVAIDGFFVEVSGDNTSEFDNYYVEFKGTGISEGVWKETVKSGEEYQLDSSTMPHALIRQADGSFSFESIEWGERVVGDLDSAPFPSFVGRQIADIFFYRNRLGFASDENIIFSKAGSFFDFFRGTATAVLDDDPIDNGVSHVKVSLIKQVVPFNESLLMFSDQTQFQTGDAATLTAETISINATTEYECSLKAKPVGVGKYVYFATNHGNYSGVREYYVDKDTESEQAGEVTAHVPKYLKGKIRSMVASSSEDILAVLTEDDLTTIYIYKFYFSGDEKLQASWSVWRSGDNAEVLDCSFIESNMYVKLSREDGVHLEVVNLSAEVAEEDWDVRVRLDSKVNHNDVTATIETNVPSPTGSTVTRIPLPYKLADDDELELIAGPDGTITKGTILKPLTVDNSGETSITYFDADLTGQKFYIGRPYTSRYKLSRLLMRETAPNGGQNAVTQGRLQLRKAEVILADTGYLRVEVTPLNRQKYTYVFTGNVIGGGSIIGEVAIRGGAMSFPILARNTEVDIEFINDTYLPS